MFIRLLLFLPALLCAVNSLSAQLVVYKMEFTRSGESLNFRPFNTGFYVAPAAGGKGTLLLGVVNGSARGQVTKDSAGDFFAVQEGSKKRAALTATTTNDSASINMLLLGEPKKSLSTTTAEGVTTRARVPEFMSGTMLLSDTAADTGTTAAANAAAGVAKVKARIDADLSESLSTRNITLAAAVTLLQTRLTNQGYTGDTAATATTTTGTTASVTIPATTASGN